MDALAAIVVLTLVVVSATVVALEGVLGRQPARVPARAVHRRR